MTTPLLPYFARFDGGCEIVGFGWGGYKKSRPWCSLFIGFPFLIVAPSCEQLDLPMCWRRTSLSTFFLVFVSLLVDLDGHTQGSMSVAWGD